MLHILFSALIYSMAWTTYAAREPREGHKLFCDFCLVLNPFEYGGMYCDSLVHMLNFTLLHLIKSAVNTLSQIFLVGFSSQRLIIVTM